MGRVWKRSNPTEMDANWNPAGDDATNGWIWTEQQYDWQSRPTVTVNPDGTQRVTDYDGCGCAGGNIVTTRDEAGRQRRYFNDTLGRLAKVQELDFYPGNSASSTTFYQYNARDQITKIGQYEGYVAIDNPNDPTARVRSFAFDGHGRLHQRVTPEQGIANYTYLPDDTLDTITDARGIVTNFDYERRGLVTQVSYSGGGATSTAPVTFAYDTAGNRADMWDGFGHAEYNYDPSSRRTQETRGLSTAGLGNYTFNYTYTWAGALKSVTNQAGSQVNYGYDATGRLTGVTGSGQNSAATYLQTALYRAFGAPKEVDYGNGRKLYLDYNKRLFLTQWNLPSPDGDNTRTKALGYTYDYNRYGENNTGRPDFAQSLYDSTLDRAWSYDHVGRLNVAYTGLEAHAQWGTATGPYAQGFSYDTFGNITARYGWGGENANYTANYNNKNQNTALAYDPAGNLANDGAQSFQYDATGQQTYASNSNTSMGYDGDGLRVKKTEGTGKNMGTTYYLRSSVLGGQVIAEIGPTGTWRRGYVYLGGQLLAIQDVAQNQVLWAHQEPYSKGQRLTDANGAITARLEFDPFGGAVSNNLPHTPTGGWVANEALQRKKFTTYERDANGGDEAMMRRYEKKWSRFTQPDPYDGSYNLRNPQTLNRYAYVGNNPVSFTDPTGLLLALVCRTYDFAINTSETQYVFSITECQIVDFGGYGGAIQPIGGGGPDIGGGGGPGSGGATPSPQDPFIKAHADCKGKLGSTPDPGITNTATIIDVANNTGVDRTLLAVTWHEESRFSDGQGLKNGIHGPNELIGDIGPGQLFPGIWGVLAQEKGLNAFGTNREVGQVFNGNARDNLLLAGFALGAAKGGSRAAAAGAYRAGNNPSNSDYQTRATTFNGFANGYDAFFDCLRQQGF